MKRNEVIELIASWAKPEILYDIYNCGIKNPVKREQNFGEWADNLLYVLENEIKMCPVSEDESGNLRSLNWEDKK